MIPTLKTKRLTLRPVSISDQDAMVDMIMSDRDVMCWLPGSDKVSTLEEQQKVSLEYIADFIEPRDKLGFGVWAICINDIELGQLETFIGYCGFIPEQLEGASRACLCYQEIYVGKRNYNRSSNYMPGLDFY